MQTIEWNDFTKVELRVGTVISAEEFKQARAPAYIITVDFGDEIGVKKTSAQVTNLYKPEQLIGKQIIGVVNFPAKQIGPMKSEFLLTGFYREDGVVLAVPDMQVENGSKIG
jgi:tRNA-binding protein